jgi:transcriptional repressor NrdR
MYANCDAEIESSKIGELVMERLALVDQVAYVRFASVYRRFKDVRDFVDELQPMLKHALPPRKG